MKIINLLLRFVKKDRPEGAEIALEKRIKKLIRKGADVNDCDKNLISSLHLTALCSLNSIAKLLIENGAAINKPSEPAKNTALHYAVETGNHEMVCMLLCYNVDVTILNWHDMAPLILSIHYKHLQIYNALKNYYVSVPFNNESYEIDEKFYKSIEYQLYFMERVKIFNLVWPKLNGYQGVILIRHRLLLNLLFTNSPPEDWIEYFYANIPILIAIDYIQMLNTNTEDMIEQKCVGHTFFSTLFVHFHKRQTSFDDRRKLINLFLSLGYKPTLSDLMRAHQFYGFGEEFKTILYIGDYNFNHCCEYNTLMPTYIMALDRDIEFTKFSLLFPGYVSYLKRFPYLQIVACLVQSQFAERDILYALRYFTFYKYVKARIFYCLQIVQVTKPISKKTIKKIRCASEFPSLLELCRNKVRSVIKDHCTIKRPYEFHDIIYKLGISKRLKDILSFRAPIY